MTDNETKKALEDYIKENEFEYFHSNMMSEYSLIKKSLNLITRQQAENDDLSYKLTGIMHSVDKWLDGDELKQDEVNRAATMREKTLQIVEKQQAEIDELKHEREVLIEDIHYSADKINDQLEEIERLRKEVNLVSIQFQDLQERYEEAQIEIAQWKEEANKYQRLWCIAIDDVDDIETATSEAIKEFAERLKNEIISETAYGCDSNQHTGYYDYQIKIDDIPEYIDNLVKELVGEE